MEANPPWWRPSPPEHVTSPADVPCQGGNSSLCYHALLAFTLVLMLAPQAWVPALAPMRIALLSAVLAMLAYVIQQLRYRRPLLQWTSATILIVCLFFWSMLTIPLSLWPGGSFDYIISMFSKTVIVFLLLTEVIDSEKKLNGMCRTLVLISAPLAWTTLSNYLAGNQLEGSGRVTGYSAGLSSNPNDMALLLNLILPICLALILGEKSGTIRFLLMMLALAIVLAILATFSRGGFLMLCVNALVYAWYLRKRPQRVWVPVALLAMITFLPLLPDSYYERISTIINIEQDVTSSAQSRLSDMKVALNYAVSHPLIGSGIGMNSLLMNELRGEVWLEVHNVYLQLWLELGLPGLLLYLMLFKSALGATTEVLRAAEKNHDNGQFYNLVEGLRVGLIGFAVAALFYPTAYHFYFYYIAGLSVASAKIFRNRLVSKG